MTKKVLIAGFNGAMGQKAVNLVNQMAGYEVAAGLSPVAKNEPEKYHLAKNIPIFTSLEQIPDRVQIFGLTLLHQKQFMRM